MRIKNLFESLVVSIIIFTVLALSGCISPQNRYLSKAEEGDAQAQGILGSMYLSGNGAAIDYKLAYYWLRNGAANGDSIAAYYLGVMCEYGHGSITPDRRRAARHYQSVYRDIHAKAQKGKIEYINILAEMYYYGRGLEQDKDKAMKMFKYCAKRRWQPAVENLGVILLSDEKFRDRSRAKSFLIESAMHNYPRAQFYLAEYYFMENDYSSGVDQLEKSSAGGYPPANFRLAQEYVKAGDPRAHKLFRRAAENGYGPAMLFVAEKTPELDLKKIWLKKAVEHNSVPAMLQYAELLKESINPDPAKRMILYLLASKIENKDPRIKKLINELDKKTGLFFPVKYTWENIKGGENILLADSEIERVVSGFKVGIVEASRKLYHERLAYNPLPFFMNNDWYLISENGLPLMWSAQLFQSVEKYEEKNPGFWISYGISAGLAGQGTAQAFAAFKLDQLAKKRAKSTGKDSLLNIAALLKANALMLMNYEDEAYTSLFNNGKLVRDEMPCLLNFVNHWCRPLLKDKRKFSAATGIQDKNLSAYSIPAKQKFVNLEYGRVIFVKSKVKEPQINFDHFKKKK